MKNYRYALSITSQFYFCGIPFRLDSMPKCSLNCEYCFAMSRGGRRTDENLLVNPQRIIRKIEKSLVKQGNDIIDDFIYQRMPIHFGGMSDPFANELSTKASMELLEFFSEIDYPIVLSTKNTSIFRNEKKLQILKEIKHLIIQISFSSCNNTLAKIIEPGVPSPMERIRDILRLKDEGLLVFARLQPIFPMYIDFIGKELIPMLGESGAKHVVLEFLKLPIESHISGIQDIFKELNWNGYDYYKEVGAAPVGREWILPNEYKWSLLRPLIDEIHKNGMTYGAGDYGLNHLGDTNCCCGMDQVEGFSNWFRPNFSNIIR